MSTEINPIINIDIHARGEPPIGGVRTFNDFAVIDLFANRALKVAGNSALTVFVDDLEAVDSFITDLQRATWRARAGGLLSDLYGISLLDVGLLSGDWVDDEAPEEFVERMAQKYCLNPKAVIAGPGR